MIYDEPPTGDDRTVPGASNDERTVPDVPDGVHTASPPRVAAAGPDFAHHPLPYGTLIEGFRITGLIGEGGFGVVYRAWDDALERHVAIKEYMPESLAVRGKASFDVSVRSERHRGTFEAGLKSFVNEARLLARFDHPALVKVLRFWEANHTAYMAMPYYEGPTLKTALDLLGGPPPEETLRDWLLPLLDALSVLHRQHYYHRDIAPDNILLTGSGPLLLDFGAARHVISDMTKTITVVLKPGYAPIEQYGGDTFQGPWTDLYALAGVVRYAITGKTPTPSVERVVNDTMQPLALSHAGRYSEGFLRAIDEALAVRPEARVQDVAQFRELLNAGLAPDSPLRFRPSGFQHSGFQASDASSSAYNRLPAADPPAPVIAPARPVRRLKAVASPRPVLRRLGKLAYAVATVALLTAGGAVWWIKVREVKTPVVAPMPVPMPMPAPAPALTAPPSAQAPAPAPAPEPRPARATEPKPARAPDPAPSPPPVAAAEPTASPIPAPEPAPVPAAKPRPASPSAVERPKPAPATRPVAESRRPPQQQAESSATTNERGRPARCSDIVTKASLGPLEPEEAAYLRRECR